MYLNEHLLNRLVSERTDHLRREADQARALSETRPGWRSRLAQLLTRLAELLEPKSAREHPYARP